MSLRLLNFAAAVVVATLVLAQPGGTADARVSTPHVRVVATFASPDYRVVVVATRTAGAPPTADVRLAVSRRVDGRWREAGELRLVDDVFFWRVVTGAHAVCYFQLVTANSATGPRPYVALSLLVSPSVGCSRTYRRPLGRPPR